MCKLVCFSILIVINSQAFSQIIYTDIADATPSATYPLDLNNDLVIDFLIQFQMPGKVMCLPQNNNAYLGYFDGVFHLPFALSSSVSICDSITTWYDSNNPGIMAWGTQTGSWIGVTDKYLALKLVVGINTYFGWVRLDFVANSTSFTVKDYAYESTPNTCIQAGQSALGISENSDPNKISLYPNPFVSSSTLHLNGNFRELTVTIFNSYGQMVNQIGNILDKTITLSRDNLPCGTYFIQLTNENNIISIKKLVITE